MNKSHYTISFAPHILVPFFLLFIIITMISCSGFIEGGRGSSGAHEKGNHLQSNIIAPEGMALIPGGKYTAGIDPDRAYEECAKYFERCKKHWYENQGPEHKVFVDTFFMDKYEVTQEAFERVMGNNPSPIKGTNHPVGYVTWYEAQEYCEKSGKRLPTEAEWEKAARGGKNTMYPWGDEFDGSYAWYRKNSGERAHPVGQKKPTEYGLYDMMGNVAEFVFDWYSPTYYDNSPRKNPKGPSSGTKKVKRGGSWHCSTIPGTDYSDDLQSAFRYPQNPTLRAGSTGFRCASSPSTRIVRR